MVPWTTTDPAVHHRPGTQGDGAARWSCARGRLRALGLAITVLRERETEMRGTSPRARDNGAETERARRLARRAAVVRRSSMRCYGVGELVVVA
jgi:hypothetical protein